jgi:hypothetical protein
MSSEKLEKRETVRCPYSDDELPQEDGVVPRLTMSCWWWADIAVTEASNEILGCLSEVGDR